MTTKLDEVIKVQNDGNDLKSGKKIVNFDEILFLDKILTFRKLRIVTDLNKSEFKNAQEILVKLCYS